MKRQGVAGSDAGCRGPGAAADNVRAAAWSEVRAWDPAAQLGSAAGAAPEVAAIGFFPAEAVIGVECADHKAAGVGADVDVGYIGPNFPLVSLGCRVSRDSNNCAHCDT